MSLETDPIQHRSDVAQRFRQVERLLDETPEAVFRLAAKSLGYVQRFDECSGCRRAFHKGRLMVGYRDPEHPLCEDCF